VHKLRELSVPLDSPAESQPTLALWFRSPISGRVRHLILCLPLLAALVIAFIPREIRFGIRLIALGTTLVTMLLGLLLFLKFQTGLPGYQFELTVPWIKALRINYHVGVDGINIGLIFMGAVVSFAAACVSWEITTHEKEFYILLMVMTGGILGAFASLDLFFFYFFPIR
jgi:NADH-quinone oxidoreductase subunit M